MDYKLINQEVVKGLEGQDDSMLNSGLMLKVAEGTTPSGKAVFAQLRAVGDIKCKLKKGKNIVDINNGNILDYFATNEELQKAVAEDKLLVIDNNWYDVEYIVDSEYVEPSDQDVVFSLSEGVELVKATFANEEFINYLEEK